MKAAKKGVFLMAVLPFVRQQGKNIICNIYRHTVIKIRLQMVIATGGLDNDLISTQCDLLI